MIINGEFILFFQKLKECSSSLCDIFSLENYNKTFNNEKRYLIKFTKSIIRINVNCFSLGFSALQSCTIKSYML